MQVTSQGISHVPAEAEPAASECEGRVPAFLAAGTSGLGGGVLIKPPCLQGGGSWCGVDPACITRINGMKLGKGESRQETFPQGESY